MNNADKMRDLLADYAQGKLDADDCRRVEQELAVSAELRQECERLRAYYRVLGKKSDIKAPPDFLIRVNERIDRPGFLGRVLEILFLGSRLKVPVEILGVAATAGIVVVVLHPFDMQKHPVPTRDAAPEAYQALAPAPAPASSAVENQDESTKRTPAA